MPTIAEVRSQYPQYHDMSDADLAGALHQKFYADMPKEEFDKKIGLAPAPDKYQQAAIEDVSAAEKAGTANVGLTRRLAHGATLGADSTLLAAAETPLEMIKRGTFNPVEGYSYAKAREDEEMKRARENTGIVGTGAEILGGGAAGLGLANGGITAARFLGPNAGTVARLGANAADSAGIGAFSGGMEGNGLKERLANALQGGAIGGALGVGIPLAAKGVSMLASPIVSNVMARFNPTGYAEGQAARAVAESRLNPNDVEQAVRQAGAEGQGVYTVADALGNSGQRMLRAAASGPGEARTAIVDALEGRQAGQGRRVANSLAEGFEAPQTAERTRDAMTAARAAAADAEYGAVRQAPNQVDVVPAINNIDRTIGTAPGQHLTASNDSIEAVLRPYRERLARVNPDDFEAVQRIRSDMADAAQNARQSGYGNRARLIGAALRDLDTSMETASPGFRQANANFRQRSQDIEAVGLGEHAQAGRPENNIEDFLAQSIEGQRGYRAGYADPLVRKALRSAEGANKARPLTSEAFQREAEVMAPGNDLMQRRIGRENTMFETRNTALGGSKTDMNLADAEAMGISPEMLGMAGHLVSGNLHGAMRSALSAGKNLFTGNTPEVRREVARILLQSGNNANVGQIVQRVAATTAQRQQIADALRRGVSSGGSEYAGQRK